MPDEDKVEESVVSKVTALKKAGLPTAAVILIAAMSFPGFWEFFFNKTDDEAKIKAEVSYQLLKAQTEAIGKQIDKQDAQIERLRDVVNALVLERGHVVGYGMGASPPMAPETIPEPAAPEPLLKPLPMNLDTLAQQRME